MSNDDRARTLPFLGGGEEPPHTAGSQSAKGQGFVAIALIFARTWPYLSTYILGYWKEIGVKRQDSTSESVSEVSQDNDTDKGWSFYHVPPLVTLVMALGPVTGWVPLNTSWLFDFLLFSTALMAVLTWALLFLKGRLYLLASLALVGTGTVTLLFAFFVVEGVSDNIFTALICAASACIWVVQYRLDEGRIRVRIRLGSHLAYYFILLWVSTLLLMLLALFSVDVVSQSILQAKPLTPFIAELIDEPQMAGTINLDDSTDLPAEGESSDDSTSLTNEQRQSLKWVYAAFLMIGWIVQLPLGFALPYYYIYIMQRVNQDLRVALLERWHLLSLRYHSDHRVGDSVYRLYQDSAQVTAVIGEIIRALQVIITYGTGLLFLTALDPLLSLMALAIIFGAMAWGYWFSPRMRTRSLASRRTNSDFTSRVQETFASARLIKAYGAEEREQQRFEQDSVYAFNASYRVRSFMVVVAIITFTIAASALLYGQFLTAIWAVGERETYASILVGLVGLSFLKWNLSAYQTAQEHLGASSVSVRDLIEHWTRAQDMAMGLNRVFDILDIEPDVKNSEDAIPMTGLNREIQFDKVSFAYEPNRPVLNNVSFTVKPGTVTAIVGPTGSGKSSLMSMMSRLFDPDSGTISIDGVDLRDIEVDSLRENVSIALQENVLFGISLRDNIRYVVPDATDEEVLSATRVACVEEYIDGLPDGLDTVLSDRGGKLSTGQRQRLSIARAIVKDTPILILDEPTAALDADTEHQVLQRLVEWGENRVIFLITHRISTIQKSDAIMYLDHGELIEHGSHEELMALDGGRYRNFVEMEAKLSKRENFSGSSERES